MESALGLRYSEVCWECRTHSLYFHGSHPLLAHDGATLREELAATVAHAQSLLLNLLLIAPAHVWSSFERLDILQLLCV
jgi:hypothetical protein